MDKRIDAEVERKLPAFSRIENAAKKLGARGLLISENVGNLTANKHGVVMFPVGEISKISALAELDDEVFDKAVKAVIEHEVEHTRGITHWMIEHAVNKSKRYVREIENFMGIAPTAYLEHRYLTHTRLLSWYFSEYQALLQQLANYGNKEKFMDSLAYQLLESLIAKHGLTILAEKHEFKRNELKEWHNSIFSNKCLCYSLNCFKNDGNMIWQLFDIKQEQKERWTRAQHLLAGFDTGLFLEEVSERLCEIEKNLCKKMVHK